MRKSARAMLWRVSLAIMVAGLAPAHAAELGNGMPSAPVAAPQATMDPALQRALSSMATTLLTSFAASLANGTSDGFDPGPAIEKTLRGVLSSAELGNLIDRVAGQVLASGGNAASDLPPELRAALALAARNLMTSARREIARELANP